MEKQKKTKEEVRKDTITTLKVMGVLFVAWYVLATYPIVWQLPLAVIIWVFSSIAGAFAGISSTTVLLLIIIWQLDQRSKE